MQEENKADEKSRVALQKKRTDELLDHLAWVRSMYPKSSEKADEDSKGQDTGKDEAAEKP